MFGTKKNTYAGIGSRSTPEDAQLKMTGMAEWLEKQGLVLRSGAAQGADQAFENGVKFSYNKEIFLPWGGFNGSKSVLSKPTAQAHELAEQMIPHWRNLSDGARKLAARNMQQVLGQHLQDPVKFVICWTPNGKTVGGTASAITLAYKLQIPVFNLGAMDIQEACSNIEGIVRWLK